jgi:hypothetical protein
MKFKAGGSKIPGRELNTYSRKEAYGRIWVHICSLMRWSIYKKAVTFGYSPKRRIRTAWGDCKYTFKMLKMFKGRIALKIKEEQKYNNT